MAGPSYMSDSQMGSYLQNLRSNRPTRPAGSRPPPNSQRRSVVDDRRRESTGPNSSGDAPPSRSSSALSYYYDSTSSGSSSNRNSIPAHVQDPRRLERRESRALRLAMEDLEVKGGKDGAEVYNQARAEAEELLRSHQSPRNTLILDDAPKPVREDSFDLDTLLDDYDEEPTLHEDKPMPPPAPRARFAQPKRESSSSEELPADLAVRKMSSRGWLSKKKAHEEDPNNLDDESVARKLSQKLSFSNLAGKRKSSGTRKASGRKASGSNFPNATEKIYEDPVERVVPPPVEEPKPFATRRNPFQRYQSTRESVDLPSSTAAPRPRYRQEIWRNDPTQSRDPGYIRNNVVPSPPAVERQPSESSSRDGVEVRSDDIRAATSKRIGGRSAKLPSPTAVGDRSRPIISFDPNWKPAGKEEDLTGTAPKLIRGRTSSSSLKSASAPAIPNADRPQAKSSEPVNYPSIYTLLGEEEPVVKGIDRIPSSESLRSRGQSLPKIEVSHMDTAGADDTETQSAPVRSTQPALPSISIQSEDEVYPNDAGPLFSIPQINLPDDTPHVKVDEPEFQAGKTRSRHGQQPPPSARPSPVHAATVPVSSGGNPFTPMHTRRAGLCAQCALPISGRIVTAAGTRFHPECFKCFHCSEALECVAFYPEPAEKRDERLDLIARRAAGEDVEGVDSDDADDDGLRFYCHLDYHEMFSPRCKSCKTPIEGEVVVACGAEWHVGHFFCAQCGDPFDPTIPFVEKDGYAWCVKCHTNRFSAKCRKCRRPVTDTVVKALGAEWHVGCFCCGECGSAFEDGRYFMRTPEEEQASAAAPMVVCFACEEKRLKA